MYLPMTTPSTLGPNALSKSGWRIGVDSNASSGRSRKHFINCESGKSGEQLTWWEIMAAYLAGSFTRDHGDKPEPDINIARWNNKPASNQQQHDSIFSNMKINKHKQWISYDVYRYENGLLILHMFFKISNWKWSVPVDRYCRSIGVFSKWTTYFKYVKCLFM